MHLEEGLSNTAVEIPKRRLCRPPLVEYGLMGNDGRGQSIKLIPEVENGGRISMRSNPFLRFHWKGLIKDYKELYLSDEDRERIHNNLLRPMLQSWVENAQDPTYWMTFENLPMLFRFALRRPLIPEQTLIKRLDEIGVMNYLPIADESEKDVVEERNVHAIEERVRHVSTKYIHRIPLGNASDGPLVTWVHDQPAMDSPAAKKTKRKVSFVLSSLSEGDQELIEGVADAIVLRRRGCLTSEQTLDEIRKEFTGYDYDYLKYLSDIESGSASPQSLAERIFEDTKEEAPSLPDDDHPRMDEDKDHDENIIREVAKSIFLCRSGSCTPQQTVEMLHDQFIGYRHDFSKHLSEITFGRISPNSLAKSIYKDTGMELTHGTEEAKGDKGRHIEYNNSETFQSVLSARQGSSKPKVSIKFKFNVKSRFQDIYQQVLMGRTLPQEALSMFRAAAEKPDISDKELAIMMTEHGVPFDLFFSCESSELDRQVPHEAEEYCEANSQINTIVGPLTPQDSRRTSKLLNPCDNPSSVARFPEPDTPPEDSSPIKDNELGATLRSHSSGNDKTAMLIHALQMLMDSEPHDSSRIDVSGEKTELPSSFPERTSEIVGRHQEHERCSTIANSTTISDSSDENGRVKSDICVAEDHVSSLPDPVGHTSFLSRTCFAMKPVQTASEVREFHLLPGSNHRARVRHGTDVGGKWDDSNPDLRKHDRSDWRGCAEASPGGPPDNYISICEHSSSPECGETTALWGLSMLTSKARELGRNIGLNPEYIDETFRSSTPNRDAARKITKISTRRSVPYLKRKSDSLPSEHRLHKSRKSSQVTLFAEDGDDQVSFMEKRLRAPTPMVNVRSRSRCSICKSCTCNCCQLEIYQPKITSVSVLPSIESIDHPAGGGVQSITENTGIDRECHVVANNTSSVEEAPGESGPLDSVDDLPRFKRPLDVLLRRTCPPSAHCDENIGCSLRAETVSPLSVKSEECTGSNTKGTQGTPDLVKEFDKWKTEWEKTNREQNDVVCNGDEVSPEGEASLARDDVTFVQQPEASRVSPLCSNRSNGHTIPSEQCGNTQLSLVDQPPITLSDKPVKDLANKTSESHLAVGSPSKLQSSSRSMRNASISTAFLPLTIGGLSEEVQEPSQNSHRSLDMTREHIAQPAIVARRCSVVTTMKSLTIDDEEIDLPASSYSQPRRSDQTKSDSNGCTVEHIEDLSPANLSANICSSPYRASRPPGVAEYHSTDTTVQVVDSRKVSNSTISSPRSTSTPSDCVVSMVEHIEDASAGSITPKISNTLSNIPQESDLPISCPSSPRPAAARLPPKIASFTGNNSTNSFHVFSRSMSISDNLPRERSLEHTGCTLPLAAVSAPLKRSHTGSDSSLLRPSARLRVSSPVRDPNMHQGSQPIISSLPSLMSSSPVSRPTGISQGQIYTRRKSRLLAKIDRYLGRLAQLPEAKAQQTTPWTQDTVETEAWKARASTRVFLWSKRQDRELRNGQNANNISCPRYFQNPSAAAGKSGTTSSLNKLFDRYRGITLLFFFPFLPN